MGTTLLVITALSSVIFGLAGIVVGRHIAWYASSRHTIRRLLPAHIWGMAVSYVMIVWVAVPGIFFTYTVQTTLHISGLVIGVLSLIQLVRHQQTRSKP